ncbi:MAG: trypsin-like peptidase domain-containing protein [Spirochaetia bacterium]|nr:trypsin-like peptidase domain-containing protein [Spirochaetia bacterium]
MFADAYDITKSFTRPVVISTRMYDNKVDCGCGAFLVLNKDGWIVTVAHLLNSYAVYQQNLKEIAELEEKKLRIQNDGSLNLKQKQSKLRKLKPNQKWIKNHSFWWGNDNLKLKDVIIIGEADLAIGRLESFNPESIKNYPILKNPRNLRLGTSLCKLGYPFHNISATYDETLNSFRLQPGAIPIPRFPMEGIYTRNLIIGKSKSGKVDIKFLETSTPGLRGQSGGPIFDKYGNVWAIQSHTRHLPLGFSPKLMRNNKEIEENQFINVGMGVHPETLVNLLVENKIEFSLSDS